MARIVSRSEFDSLLRSPQDAAAPHVHRSPDETPARSLTTRPVPATFGHALPNSAAGLQAVVNQLAAAFADRISELTRLDDFQMVASEARIETSPERWTARPHETQVLFESAGLSATVILALPGPTREWLIDRMLGSTLEQFATHHGQQTELDRRLEQLLLEAFASELSRHLPSDRKTTSWAVIRLPGTSRPADLLAGESELLVSEFSAVNSPHWVPVRLGFTGSLVSRLLAGHAVPSDPAATTGRSPSAWLTVEVGRVELTAQELQTLSVGDVLLSDQQLNTAFQCRWNEQPVFEAAADENPEVRAIRILRHRPVVPVEARLESTSGSA